MKVKDMNGRQLDYWVAKAAGLLSTPIFRDCDISMNNGGYGIWLSEEKFELERFFPSTNWAHGGPIIERERIEIIPWNQPAGVEDWEAKIYDPETMNPKRGMWGSTALIAAMRAFVASKFGDEVDDVQPQSAG